MSEALKIILFVSVILFFQIGIFPHLAVFGTYPNLIFVSVVSLAVLAGFKKSVIWAIISGLFLDFYSLNNLIGIFVISLIVSAFFSSFITKSIFKRSNLSSIIPVFLLTIIVYNLSVFLFYKILGFNFQLKIPGLLVSIIYNTIFAIPIFYWIKKYVVKSPKI